MTGIICSDGGRFARKVECDESRKLVRFMSGLRRLTPTAFLVVTEVIYVRLFWGRAKPQSQKTPDIIKFIIKRLSNLGHGEEIEMSFENKNLFWFVSENPDSKKEFNWTGLEFTNLCWSFRAMKFCLAKRKCLHKDRKYFRSLGCGIFDLRQDNNTSWKE